MWPCISAFPRTLTVENPAVNEAASQWLRNKSQTELWALVQHGNPQEIIPYCIALTSKLNQVVYQCKMFIFQCMCHGLWILVLEIFSWAFFWSFSLDYKIKILLVPSVFPSVFSLCQVNSCFSDHSFPFLLWQSCDSGALSSPGWMVFILCLDAFLYPTSRLPCHSLCISMFLKIKSLYSCVLLVPFWKTILLGLPLIDFLFWPVATSFVIKLDYYLLLWILSLHFNPFTRWTLSGLPRNSWIGGRSEEM